MNSLNLTDENKDAIRALVRAITPDFEERLWNSVRRREADIEAAKRQLDEWTQKQAVLTGGGVAGNTFINTPVYQPTGTGFTVYDQTVRQAGHVFTYDPANSALQAMAGLTGLTLSKP